MQRIFPIISQFRKTRFMKSACSNHILMIFSFSASLIVQSCKKSDHPNGTIIPPNEKKAIVSTVAGDGTDGFANGPALSARFDAPIDVAVAPDGSLYVADFN